MCQVCNAKGCYLEAHHIVAYGLRPDLELNADNGITLCKSCHKEVHCNVGRLCDFRLYLEERGCVIPPIT